MDKIVNLFGDSHTYGNGLEDCGLEKPWEQYSVNSWPYHVFPQAQIKNFSYPGCSNDTICLRLARHATKQNIVVIMFASPRRMHIVRNGYNFIVANDYNDAISETGNENYVARQIAIRDMEKNKKFVIDNFDDNFLEIIYLKNILWCQYFCKSNKIDYYFTMNTNWDKRPARQSLKKYRDSLYDQIDWEKIFLIDDKYGFRDYGKKINAEKGNDGSHFGLQYHKLFGNLFLDWINNKKQV